MRKALEAICEKALVEFEGFKWFSFKIEKKYPDDLLILCAFENDLVIESLKLSGELKRFTKMLDAGLKKYDVELADVRLHMKIGTEKKLSK